ncbi:hypothetical protein ACROYT_G003941 [Oculina patagonica]
MDVVSDGVNNNQDNPPPAAGDVGKDGRNVGMNADPVNGNPPPSTGVAGDNDKNGAKMSIDPDVADNHHRGSLAAPDAVEQVDSLSRASVDASLEVHTEDVFEDSSGEPSVSIRTPDVKNQEPLVGSAKSVKVSPPLDSVADSQLSALQSRPL